MADKPESAPEGGGKSKKMLLIIIIAAVVLIGGGVAAFLLLGGNSDAEAKAEQAKKDAEAIASTNIGPMVNIESFIVNILDDSGTRYLKAAMTLEVTSDKTVEEINQRMPQIKDAILLLIGNKSFSELQDLQGKMQLRAELSAKLNDLLKSGQIKRIYFTDFVVQ
ncbi:flagellar basal body protein FliL [Geothermobacter hydrogeniphilus]|uniref:Flagellar protein FliL n=1 Tax=Geothermobacter hydrogeniphilus TaxID=1969733 RepID=A0A2K2HCW1_9BACT|nr:flagellar basal body-associated FliL family protein [Geothermobacter hydrogeniphilus]PNU21127.1 flagellar basal body protein FliL [Geothermobacter hydrogeniphilus]